MRFLLSVMILLLSWAHEASSQQTYSCGSTSADPVEVPAGSANPFTSSVQKSTSKTVCVLLRVTIAPNSNASLDNISRISNLSDYNIVPVARSYAGYDWERVAGPYAQDLNSTCSSSGVCNLNIPVLSNLEYGKFYLMSFAHSLSDKATVSRFFQQTTFGPTLDMINSWNYGTNGTNTTMNAMASWVESQIGTTPITYHREYFRARVDGPQNQNLPSAKIYGPRHPCDENSSWTRMAFREEDFNIFKYSTITATERSDGTMLLSVNGVPRTVVDSWQNHLNGKNLGPGTFRLGKWCWDTEFRLYGRLSITTANGSCIRVKDGNPPINLPFSSNLVEMIDLPALSGPTQNVFIDKFYNCLSGEVYYLSSGISSSQCNDLGPSKYNHLIGITPDRKQYIYNGYVKVNENSLENPKSDGGGDFIVTPGEERCANPAMSFTNSESCYLSVEAKVCSSLYEKSQEGDAVVICGSPGEVGNGNFKQNIFRFYLSGATKFFADFGRQKRNVWSMIALESPDQLRQRMAWALSQILAISPSQIGIEYHSEMYLNYYDIFVRHAFGSYFDILKEVAYSPMMAEMLTFLDSKSTSFVLKDTGNKAFPDENFAREIMQLFTIGVHKLNMDGTPVLDAFDNPIPTYENSDIQNFARAWTGFTRLPKRANVEALDEDDNRIDPMRIEGLWRDSFPKMDLDGNFIGDTYPLCVDLPTRQFLRKGAKFRLLGSSTFTQLHYQRISNTTNPIKALVLSSSSSLYQALCNSSSGSCNFEADVTLESNIDNCDGDECFVDELRLIQLQSNPPVYYEYIRPPCVDLAFYDIGKTIQLMGEEDSMCANADLPMARDACCRNPEWNQPGAYSKCYHSFERTTFQTAKDRCEDNICSWYWIYSKGEQACQYNSEDAWYWTTDEACSLHVKVTNTGTVAMVHNPKLIGNRVVDSRVSPTNTNYFKVSWDKDIYPRPSNSCGNDVCNLVSPSECLCDMNVQDSIVFSSRPSVTSILSSLHIGGVDIARFDGEYYEAEDSGDVTVYHKNVSGGYTKDTIFKVEYHGEDGYFKNLRSTVTIGSGNFSFRNPPQFLNPSMHEARDAIYETDALLKHFFFHENIPPFLAVRLIQRFGISNPSPRYIEVVAGAFKSGYYSNGGESFGDGLRGNLGATVAAIILDREARTALLDADPTSGSLREPMLKLMSFLRANEFEQSDAAPELRLYGLQKRIGQGPHSIPNVFSFFLPEYSSPGLIKAASLKSPEGMVLTGPKIIRFLNGIISLIDWGLTSCWGGFGEENAKECGLLRKNYNNARGTLTYEPDGSKSASEIVDELALLLTGGRLHDHARTVIINSYNAAGGGTGGLKTAQKLMAVVPEFHSTNVVNANTSSRPDADIPQPSSKEYKAVVFLNLSGGCDSYNLLIPHSGCSGKDMYQHYKDVRGGIAVPQDQLLNIDTSDSGQICSTFGIHPDFPILQSLYDEGDLLWVSNMGVLQRRTTKDSWSEDTSDTILFAHNFQQREVQNMDIYESQIGRGIGGRMVDVLLRLGYKAGSVSVNGIVDALVSNDALQFVVEPDGFETFNPSSETPSLLNAVKDVNSATNIGSGLFGETWSSFLNQGLDENELLDGILESVSLDVNFTAGNDFSSQMETVAKMMKTKDSRGSDRDVFYVEIPGFDTHRDLNQLFGKLLSSVNLGIEEFKGAMVDEGLWDSVTIVMVSEFGRTLQENTGNGTDHAWGGNYFIAGGDIDGKKVLGQYPEDLDNSGSIIFAPGIVIPTTPWESVWQGISQWLGITNSADLNEVIPNRNSFWNLYDRDTLFKPPTTLAPTQEPTPQPTVPLSPLRRPH